MSHNDAYLDDDASPNDAVDGKGAGICFDPVFYREG